MYQDNQGILPFFGDLAMTQSCVEQISEKLDHSISSILKDVMLSSPGTLKCCSPFIGFIYKDHIAFQILFRVFKDQHLEVPKYLKHLLLPFGIQQDHLTICAPYLR